MVVIIPDKKIRNVKLIGYEIDLIIGELEGVPYSYYKFFEYGKLVKKLKKALENEND
jgi:hypothetical protein